MKEKLKTTLVGWQGIAAEVPADWSLAAIGGDEKSGYFRVDSTRSMALEAKWSSASSQADLRGMLERYLSDLKRKSRKRRIDFDYRIKSKEHGALSFTWQADRRAVGRLWRCDECSRVVIAQVSGAPSDNVAEAASLILPSFEDHSDEGWRTWAAYDLIAEVPPGYRLEKHQLMAGYIQLVFRKRSNRLVIERWGLADVALKKTTLADWYAERVRNDFRYYRYTVAAVDAEDEPALRITGKRRGVRQLVRSLGETVIRRRPAVFLDSYVWLCKESNKIYSVQSVHSKPEQILDEVVERVECH